MSDWHAAEKGRRLGPVTEDDLKAAIARGAFSSGALVWREGMAAWAPIGEHFPDADRPAAPRRRYSPVEGLALAISLVLLVAAIAAVIWLIYFDGLDALPTSTAAGSWLAAGVALALSSLIAPILAWRATGRIAGLELRGLLRIAIVAAACSGVVLAAANLRQAAMVGPLTVAAETYRHYRLTYVPGSRTLVVRGDIGPGLAKALKAELARNPVSRVDITSGGGLVAEAMAMAAVLQAQPDLEVAARGQCMSACIIVLMAGERRLADYDMALGFHAISSSVELEDRWHQAIMLIEGRNSDTYMISRGVPKAHLAEAARLGPGRMNMVASVDLVDSGMLSGLLDAQGRPMSVTMARIQLHADAASQPTFEDD